MERDYLDLTQHKWMLPDIEAKALSTLRAARTEGGGGDVTSR